MHSLLGQVLVLVGLAACGFGAAAGFVAGRTRALGALPWIRGAAYLFSACMLLANLVMVRALLVHDFSVSYVAQVGSLESPTWVTVVSLWSSLEGSILFWGAILGVYVSGFVYQNRARFSDYMPYALGVLLSVCAFFALLIAGPANPFREMVPAPANGPGPNPLLQNHLLMVVHPPMLYLGFVGMAVPFAIAMAALLRGRFSDGWGQPLRTWTLVPWAFLSVGIVLGGWWAYEVLGWGGYWAWDPVENASFLPWLAATGFLHSAIVQERKGVFKVWTLSLIITAFLLTILGTFMTRSGVFNSVHSFTQSSIGPIFLAFLALCLVASLVLLAGRAHLLQPETQLPHVASREGAFLINNLLLVVFTFTVLLGTVFPLLTEAVRGVKMSVGEPYFNRMAIPIGLLLVLMIGVGPMLPWGQPKWAAVWRHLLAPLCVAVIVAGVLLGLGGREPLALATMAICSFAFVATLREMWLPVGRRRYSKGEGVVAALVGSFPASRRRLGGYVVHVGVIAITLAIALSASYRTSAEASLKPNEQLIMGPFTLTFLETTKQEEAHRFSVAAQVEVRRGQELIARASPRLNFYPSQREPIGTPDVRTLGHEDLYLSLLSVEPDGSSVSIKAYVIPFVSMIWWATPLFPIGALLALWPRRRPAQVAAAVAQSL